MLLGMKSHWRKLSVLYWWKACQKKKASKLFGIPRPTLIRHVKAASMATQQSMSCDTTWWCLQNKNNLVVSVCWQDHQRWRSVESPLSQPGPTILCAEPEVVVVIVTILIWLFYPRVCDTQKPSGFCCYRVSRIKDEEQEPFTYSGDRVMEHFFDYLTEESRDIARILGKNEWCLWRSTKLTTTQQYRKCDYVYKWEIYLVLNRKISIYRFV